MAMRVFSGSLAKTFWKLVAITEWLPRQPRVVLSERDCRRLLGLYRAKDGRRCNVTCTPEGFRISGLMLGELLPIDRTTLYDSTDPEAQVKFMQLRNGGYGMMAVSHPLRLTLIALRE